MSLQAELHLISGLALIAIINWLLADRSVMRRNLEIRTTPPWVAMRWFGLGLFAASLAVRSGAGLEGSAIALAGALILLLGTARKTATVSRESSCTGRL